MSDIAVRAENLSKVYTLYPTPWARMRDIFGWKWRGGAEFPTHTAIDGMNLEIRFGEKVGFIGRNGAGKSTLLKLITGVIEPTGGWLEINGDTHALLQMGAGFHHDFTGRENAYAYLANLGLIGERADAAVDEIIAFSELEEYIDQPLKTYSTGMAMRLIFAASTTVAPKLFVIDEVLGVGDAYFQQKSFARIQELVETNQTTLLLVSHDIYSTARICDRIIWIDRGRIKFDGDPKTALNLYEGSIKEQEEQRLLRKNEMRLAKLAEAKKDRFYLQIEIRSRNNTPLPGSVWFADISLASEGQRWSLPLTQTHDSSDQFGPHLKFDASSWGKVALHSGMEARQMKNYGSPFRQVVGVLMLPRSLESLSESGAILRIEYTTEQATPLLVRLHYGDRTIDLGELPLASIGWATHEFDIRTALRTVTTALANQTAEVVHGTCDVMVTDMRIIDSEGHATLRIAHGAQMTIEMDYEIRNKEINGEADLLLGLHRESVTDVCRFFTQSIVFDAGVRSRGTVTMTVDSLPLPNGNYTISLTLARKGYFSSNPAVFYSMNPDVYTCLTRFIEFQVYGGDLVASGAGLVLKAHWAQGQGKTNEARILYGG